MMMGTVLGVAGGLLVGVTGLFMLRWGRTRASFLDESSAEMDGLPVGAGLLGTVLERVSLQSRYVIGFCLILLGYHLASYSLPAGTIWLRVPPEQLWILGVGIGVSVAGSLVLDWFGKG